MCIKPVSSKLVTNEFNDDSLVINPYDLKALIELINLKKTYDIEVDIICMGSKKCTNLLRRCRAMGADNAHLVSSSQFAGSDTLATTYILSKVIEYLDDYDFIICGNQAIDGETGQVPYGLAERLGIETIDSIEKIEKIDDNELILTQKTNTQRLYLKTHNKKLLIFDDFELNYPYISLFSLKKFCNAEIPVISTDSLKFDAEKCGNSGSKTKVISSDSNIKSKKNQQIAANNAESISMILSVLEKAR